MKPEHIRELRNNPTLRKRLANVMATCCVRNTKLEDLHAGQFPSSKTGDYSDVRVDSFGEIPWDRLSRLSDAEMKTLMADVTEHCRQFLAELFGDERSQELI